jgi:hypothetical protein
MDLNAFKKWAIDQGSVAKFTDAKYKGQCVSLISQYLGRVYGIKAGAWGNAKDWATNAEVAKLFTKVGSPQAGDIGVSGATRTNPYGHIWIYLTPTQILEQNGRVPLRVSIGVPIFKPIAILRRKGQEQDMASDRLITNIARGLLFREPENSIASTLKPMTSDDALQYVINSKERDGVNKRWNSIKALEAENAALKKQLAEAPKGYVEIKEKLYRKG